MTDELLELMGPLIPVSEVDQSDLPIVILGPSKVLALSILGAERANGSPGTIENHERGVLGEYAAARYLGVPEALDTEIYDAGDPGYDLRFRGKRIDVKTAGPRENNPPLRVSTHGELRADFYILVHQLNRNNYRIMGYASRPQVERARTFTYSRSKAHWPDKYGDEVYIVEQDLLRPITSLGDRTSQ